jgi:hypothetical protein
MKIMARICLHQTDAELGIAALRKRGYAVLTHVFNEEPDHVFVEAAREFDHQANEYDLSCLVLDEASEIVDPLWGNIDDAGPLDPRHIPFRYDLPPWSGV